MAWYMVWPVGHGIVYRMTGEVRHGIWYSLVGMAWYSIWPGEVWHGIWYGLLGEVWHYILYGLADIAWYMITPGEVWNGMWKCLCEFHVLWHCLGLWSRSDVSWRSSSHIQDPFTSRGTVTCMFRSHVHLLFTLGRDSKLRDCEYISLFWYRTLDSHS